VVSNDMQMTLFTLEALLDSRPLWADKNAVVHALRRSALRLIDDTIHGHNPNA
jgi:hypothetical protein